MAPVNAGFLSLGLLCVEALNAPRTSARLRYIDRAKLSDGKIYGNRNWYCGLYYVVYQETPGVAQLTGFMAGTFGIAFSGVGLD
jgi:hypothetical protein